MTLINMFAPKRHTHTTQQQPRIPIGIRTRVDGDMTAWNHLRRIHIVIDLYLRKQGHDIGLKAKGDVPTAIARGGADASPVLDARHDDIDTFGEEMVHVFLLEFGGHGDGGLVFDEGPLRFRVAGLVGCDADVGDGLDGHAGDVEVLAATGGGLFDEGVNGDALELGDVVEGDWFAEEAQDVAASRPTEGAVFMVGRAFVPAAKTLGFRRWTEAGRHVLIAHC